MKKLIGLLFPLILLPSILTAQEYHNIVAGGSAFYTGSASGSGFLSVVVIQSATSLGNGDTLFIPVNTIRPYLSNSILDTVGGIFGQKIIRRSNGWFQFLNSTGDTLYLNCGAGLNDSWKFCNLPSGGKIEATCTAIHAISVLGSADTAKEISFQAKNASGVGIAHYYNGKTIQLSKHYGLTRVFDFYHMPDSTDLFTLQGKNSPSIGFQGMTWHDVYDFEAGDEFHSVAYTNYLWGSHPTHKTTRTIRKVLSKQVTSAPDGAGVTYVFSRCSELEDLNPVTGTSYSYTYDTVQASYPYGSSLADPTINWPPEQFTHTKYRYYSTLYNLIPGRPAYGKRDNRYACCWTDYPYYQMYAKDEREYAAGLGQVHYRNYWTYFDLVYYDTDDLVYYKKGNESWGNPLFSSCSAMIPFLSVTPAEITLDFQAGSPGLLSVSTNRGWHISNPANDPWIEFSPSGGNGNGTVNITANAANTVNTVRTAYLLLESPAGNKTIAVRQLPDPSLFMLSAVPDTVVLEAPAASSANLYVTSNNEWTVVNYLPPAWLWYDHFGGTGNGTVNFRSASENSNENPRFATLLLENLVGSHSFTVMQKGRATGISGQTEPKVMVSPNPAGNAAKLTVMGFPVNRSKNLEVFDMTGRTVFSDSFDTDSRLFNRGSLAPGIYLLKICDQRNETMAIQKLVLE